MNDCTKRDDARDSKGGGSGGHPSASKSGGHPSAPRDLRGTRDSRGAAAA